jgi:hypothetical protein
LDESYIHTFHLKNTTNKCVPHARSPQNTFYIPKTHHQKYRWTCGFLKCNLFDQSYSSMAGLPIRIQISQRSKFASSAFSFRMILGVQNTIAKRFYILIHICMYAATT